MALKGAEQVLLFDAMFIILLAAYGTGVNDVSLAPLQNLPLPRIVPLVVCQITDLSCNTGNIGLAIGDILAFFGFIIVAGILLFTVAFQVVFNPKVTSNGIPIVGFFFTAVQLVVAFEVVRIIRGSSSGY
jgi:hypothetical protein